MNCESPAQYRICCKYPTGKTERGEFLDFATALAWLKHLKPKYPEIKHWIEHANGDIVRD